MTAVPYTGLPSYLAIFAQGSGWAGWNMEMLLLGLIMFFIATFVYMFAIAFNLPSVKAWAKAEYMQVLATFIIAGSIIAFVAILWPLMSSAIIYLYNMANPYDPTFRGAQFVTPGQAYIDPFQFSTAYIEGSMLKCQKTVYRTAYGLNLMFEFYQTFANEPIGTEPLGGWYASLYTGMFKYIAGNSANAILLNYVQIRFLGMIKYMMPPLILIGLILRGFAPTRGAGGLFLAVGFGFFFVYPIAIAILIALQPLPQESFCTTVKPPEVIDPSVETAISLTNPGEQLSYLSALDENSNEVASLAAKMRNLIPVFYLQAVYFPLVALIVTFTFVREMSSLFGADLNEIGRGLIKLI